MTKSKEQKIEELELVLNAIKFELDRIRPYKISLLSIGKIIENYEDNKKASNQNRI